MLLAARHTNFTYFSSNTAEQKASSGLCWLCQKAQGPAQSVLDTQNRSELNPAYSTAILIVLLIFAVIISMLFLH